MNFGKVIKEELTLKPIKEEHCKKSFLSGLIRGSGVLYEKDGKYGLEFRVSDEKIADLASYLLQSLCNYEVREISVSDDHLNKKDVFLINIYGKNALETLEILGIIKNDSDKLSINYDLLSVCEERECCIKSFLKGLFLSCGGCFVPSRNESIGYHLELTFSHSKTAEKIAETLSKFGINAKIIRRKESFVLYLKSADEIKDFIALLSASKSVLTLSNIIIEKELSNNSNRQANCDIGNVNRQIGASIKQIEAIDKIEKTIGLKNIKKELFEVAKARKEFADDSLEELAERLNISKSCLNHRLRKIIQISNEQ